MLSPWWQSWPPTQQLLDQSTRFACMVAEQVQQWKVSPAAVRSSSGRQSSAEGRQTLSALPDGLGLR
eukprot:scaffold38_cov415-Prasinococcus_capsulatus_cf.AAC.13